MLTQHSLFLQHTFGKILIIQNDEALENKLATFDIEDDEWNQEAVNSHNKFT